MPSTPVPADSPDFSCPISYSKVVSPMQEDWESVASNSRGPAGYLTDSAIRALLVRFTDGTPIETLDPWFSQWLTNPADILPENIALMDAAWLSQWGKGSLEDLHNTAFPRPFFNPDGTLKELKRIILPCNILNRHWVTIAIDTATREWYLFDSWPSRRAEKYCTKLLAKFEAVFGHLWIDQAFEEYAGFPFELRVAGAMRQVEDNTCGIHTIRNAYLLAMGRTPPSENTAGNWDAGEVRELYAGILKDIMG